MRPAEIRIPIRLVKVSAIAGITISLPKDQFALKASPRKILGKEYAKIVAIAINGPTKSETRTKATTDAAQLYRLPQRIPISAIPEGATKVASKLRKGTVDPTIVNITTMVDTKAVSTIALVFVLFINHHSYIRRYINWYLLIITV